jgi:type IV secretory pathway VirB3-like protein
VLFGIALVFIMNVIVALSGQIYNSVIVAILVGKYLMVEQGKNTRGEAN